MDGERYKYGVKHVDGRFEFSEGANSHEAIIALGWSEAEVRRTLPVEALHAKKPMPDEVKALLKARQAERRAVRAPKRRRK